MCFMCDGGTTEDYDLAVTANIKDFGWHLTGVEQSARSPSWVYSIGLIERFDHPELIVTGICCMPCAAQGLNEIGTLIQEGSRFSTGDELAGGCPGGTARFGAVHPSHWTTDRFNAWVNHYGPQRQTLEPSALQVITRSLDGPWQDEIQSQWHRLRLDRPALRRPRRRHAR